MKAVRYVVWLLLLLLLISAVWVSWRLLDAIIVGAVVAYLVHPVFLYLNKYAKNKTLSASLILLLVVLPVVLIFTYTIIVVVREATAFISTVPIPSEETIRALIGPYLAKFRLEDLTTDVISKIYGVISPILSATLQKIGEIPILLLKIFILIASVFYLVRDGTSVKEMIINLTPKEYREVVNDLFHYIDICFHAMFIGHFMTSLATGLLAAILYLILGIKYSILLGALTALVAIIPVIGAWLVYIPLSLIFIAGGELVIGLIIFFYGVIVESILPDMYIRPKLAAKSGMIHPMVILIGFIGGPLIMGAIGLIVGPAILGTVKAVIDTYLKYRTVE